MTKPMKRPQVERALRAAGCTSIRDRGRHEVWQCPCGEHTTALPAAQRDHGRRGPEHRAADRVPAEGVVAVTERYTATAAREGRWWVITVPDIGVTQARSLAEAEDAARGLISAMLDTDEEGIDVTVAPALDPKVADLVQRARHSVSELDTIQRRTANLSRVAVTALTDQGISGRDVAAILKVSPQRVSQLRHEGPARIVGKA